MLARTLYELESLPPAQWQERDDEIENVARHASDLVASAEALDHERDLIKGGGDLTPPAYFQAAIDAVRAVDVARADDIAADLNRPRQPSEALAAWDRIALRLADLGALSGVDDTEAGSPARVRALAAIPRERPAGLEPKPIPDRPDQLTLPVSPLAIIVLGLLGLVVCAVWASSSLWMATKASVTTGVDMM